MFAVVSNLPGGIIPAVMPKEGCCTIHPCAACELCEACGPVSETCAPVVLSESDMLFSIGLFQL